MEIKPTQPPIINPTRDLATLHFVSGFNLLARIFGIFIVICFDLCDVRVWKVPNEGIP